MLFDRILLTVSLTDLTTGREDRSRVRLIQRRQNCFLRKIFRDQTEGRSL